jgi:D-alanyl-D-alanine carboxypeptidase
LQLTMQRPRRHARGGGLRWSLSGAVMVWLLCSAMPAAARHWHAPAAHAPIFEWVVLDADTGQVLGEQNADAITYPASLTKMMTLYLTFQALNQGHVTLDTRFSVSPYAASRPPTKLGLVPGETVSVQSLILGIVTKSANDAATVLAEGLGGSEANFCAYMNLTARQLGMDHTNFANASGLPDPEQHTTARDMAHLALALNHQFPREYRFFATKEFEFRGRIVRGHDHLLDWYPGADGIKTGFIDASGFNIATSAVQNGHRLIGVVMGGRTAHIRDLQVASLLDQGFATLNRGQPATVPRPAVVAAAAPAAPPVVAAAVQPITAAAPIVRPALPASQARSIPVVASDEHNKHGDLLGAAVRRLAPVGRAEAAPLADRSRPTDDWDIQIGVFRAHAAAAHAAREATHLAIARGKPRRIFAVRAEHQRLYRARLLHFTEQGAQTACSELRRRGFVCTVLRPGAAHLAS